MASEDLPSFKQPPVVETVLGVQFDRIENLTNARLGAFWKRLGSEWADTQDAPALEPVFEHFGAEQTWRHFAPRFTLTRDPAARLQIRNVDKQRMIQVQRDRFHYNWLGYHRSEYQRYKNIRPQFDEQLNAFREFLASEGLGELVPNQWEITYVNHIPKGTVWNEPADWPSVLKGLLGEWSAPTSVKCESLRSVWHYEIAPQRGRLHVEAEPARVQQPEKAEVLKLVLTARGPVSADQAAGPSLGEGLDLGRSCIVKTFAEVTSEDAHRHWGRVT